MSIGSKFLHCIDHNYSIRWQQLFRPAAVLMCDNFLPLFLQCLTIRSHCIARTNYPPQQLPFHFSLIQWYDRYRLQLVLCLSRLPHCTDHRYYPLPPLWSRTCHFLIQWYENFLQLLLRCSPKHSHCTDHHNYPLPQQRFCRSLNQRYDNYPSQSGLFQSTCLHCIARNCYFPQQSPFRLFLARLYNTRLRQPGRYLSRLSHCIAQELFLPVATTLPLTFRPTV